SEKKEFLDLMHAVRTGLNRHIFPWFFKTQRKGPAEPTDTAWTIIVAMGTLNATPTLPKVQQVPVRAHFVDALDHLTRYGTPWPWIRLARGYLTAGNDRIDEYLQGFAIFKGVRSGSRD
ncbi:hypothetical protein, partial [Streptomyces malaysiensis]|uniref:hypothetical protein n=1 Tax=Streptomyces malaysiensis TaxID=92644 RepID=UPI00321ADDC9